LRAASHEIGESVSFAMLDGDEAVYVAHAFVPSRFTLNMVTVGSRVPLAPTAIGRAFLAFLAKNERDALRARLGIAAYTPHSLGESNGFGDLLSVIRLRGFSFTESEYVEGVSSLALPVFGRDSQVNGAVSIIFPQGQYDEKQLHEKVI